MRISKFSSCLSKVTLHLYLEYQPVKQIITVFSINHTENKYLRWQNAVFSEQFRKWFLCYLPRFKNWSNAVKSLHDGIVLWIEVTCGSWPRKQQSLLTYKLLMQLCSSTCKHLNLRLRTYPCKHVILYSSALHTCKSSTVQRVPLQTR